MAKAATVTFREPNHDGGALIVWITETYQAALGDALENSSVDLFEDLDGSFVGLEASDPREVLEIAPRLRALPLGLIDVPAAGLYGIHPADALLWGYKHLYPNYPSYTIAELRAKLNKVAPDDVKGFAAVYCDYVQSDWSKFGDDRRSFENELVRRSDAANRR